MQTLIGLFGFLVVINFSLIVLRKYPIIADVILIALILRIGASFVHYFFTGLPDGATDAVGFESVSWYWAQDGFLGTFTHFFEKGGVWFYANAGSLIYSITGRSPLLLQSVSVFVGVYCVIFSYKLSEYVWNIPSAERTTASLVAVYPMLVLYSALTMREAFITLALLYALINVVKWLESARSRYAILALAAFSTGFILHPGIVIGGLLFFGLLSIHSVRRVYADSDQMKIPFITIYLIAIVSILATFISIEDVLDLQYISFVVSTGSIEAYLNAYMGSSFAGTASFPEWLIADSITQYILLIVPKLLYYLFSPFPWDIANAAQSFGLIDSLFHLFSAFIIIKNRKAFLQNPKALTVILFFMVISLVYSVATANFGTAIRHRSVLLPLLIVLIGPFIKPLFSAKNIYSISSDISDPALNKASKPR